MVQLLVPLSAMKTHSPLPFGLALAAALASSCMSLNEAKKPDLQPHVKDWREEIIYQVLVDRFANGDAANDFNVHPGVPARYHGGDWKGLEDKLEYIQALGVTTLWISPIIKNVETDAGVDGYHGYWAQDLTQLNPHFGEIGSLRRLVRACHQVGIKVIVDIVTNHLGQMFYYDINENGQPDTQLSNSGERFDGKGNVVPVHYQTEYDPDFDPRGVQARTSLGESGLAPVIFVYNPATNQMPVWAFGAHPDIFQQARAYHRKGRVVDFGATTKVCPGDTTLKCPADCPADTCIDYFYQTELGDFPGGLKDVATELPEVRDAMIESYLHWVVETDIDGFRIDTLKHVEHGFWQTFAPAIRKRLTAAGKVNFLMFGESFDGDDHKNGSYTQKGELDSVFYFAQKFQVFDDVIKNHGPTSKIKALWDARASNYGAEAQENGVVIPPPKLLVSFLDNHDVPRFLYGQTDTKALHEALLLLLTEDGIPCLYYGTEQDYAGGNDPANREDLWASGYDTSGETFRLVSFLAGIRRSHPALTKGDQKILFSTDHTGDEPDAGLFAFARGGGDAGDAQAIIVLNTNPAHQSQATIPTDLSAGTVLVDKLHQDAQVTVGPGGGLDVIIDPLQGALLVPR